MRISDWSSDVCSSDLGQYPPVRLLSVDPRAPRCAGQGDHGRSGSAAEPANDLGLSGEGLSPLLLARGPGLALVGRARGRNERSEEHTSELQSLMSHSYAVFCLKKKTLHIQP